MKKYTVNLNNTSLNKDPVTYLYALFGFSHKNNKTFQTLYSALVEFKEDLYIELIQFGLVSDSMMELINLFENVSSKNNHIHLVQSVM